MSSKRATKSVTVVFFYFIRIISSEVISNQRKKVKKLKDPEEIIFLERVGEVKLISVKKRNEKYLVFSFI